MKLIINIPDRVYEEMLKNKGTDKSLDYNEGLILEVAAENGIPLPKGHGRLIDADEFSKRLVNASQFYRGEKEDMFDTRFADGLKEADIKLVDAPTIIEADKENK